jgi:hypothetical protein
MAVIERTNVVDEAQIVSWEVSATPFSGSSGTLAGQCEPGGIVKDVTNNILYQNEGTKASPYYTPVSYSQEGLLAYHSDGWKDQVSKAVANTDASTMLSSGVRVFGQGIAETDSGAVVASAEGGNEVTLTSTNEASHLAVLGTDAGIFQPDQHGACIVVDAEFAVSADLDTKTVAIGFVGTAADALDPPVTSSGTTLTLVQDDLVLALMDAALTDAAGIMIPHNKSNAAASIETTATGVDTGSDIEAAGTYQRLRVELQRTTTTVKAVVFKDKAQIGSIADALDEDEECSPVLYIGSGTTSTEALAVRHFATWGLRA